MRLADRKLLETSWETVEPGRPPRHLYRLTAEGVRFAREHRRLGSLNRMQQVWKRGERLMTARRRWAVAMLRAVIRHAPEASREWASAMLRELDYIESDWAALSGGPGKRGRNLQACGR